MQFQTPTAWDSARYDAYTFYLAMAHLRAARPRVLYLAFDETDDWAHGGRYDRVLDALSRTDGYLKELWTWLQSQPEYGRTHILITTDHGRGHTTEDWKTHGAKIEGAQETWIAFISPAMSQRGEWRNQPAIYTNQVAATIASRGLGAIRTVGKTGGPADHEVDASECGATAPDATRTEIEECHRTALAGDSGRAHSAPDLASRRRCRANPGLLRHLLRLARLPLPEGCGVAHGSLSQPGEAGSHAACASSCHPCATAQWTIGASDAGTRLDKFLAAARPRSAPAARPPPRSNAARSTSTARKR